ncbi:MAG: hypothetical protein PHF84_05225 [bacterium]|nr:hypothetical protein [bacterium]
MKKYFLFIIPVMVLSVVPLFSADIKAKPDKAKEIKKEISLKPGDIMVADFEGHPNNLGGAVGVYGDGEPDWSKPAETHSWYYEPQLKDYSRKNVHSGAQSFRLVHGQKGISQQWASFGCDLGPDLDISVTPKKVKALDVSQCKSFVFWIKGAKGGEKFKVIFRDSHAPSYMPQAKTDPLPKGCTQEWQQVVIPLSGIEDRVDLRNMVHAGLEFGINTGNAKGAVFYLDDWAFVK